MGEEEPFDYFIENSLYSKKELLFSHYRWILSKAISYKNHQLNNGFDLESAVDQIRSDIKKRRVKYEVPARYAMVLLYRELGYSGKEKRELRKLARALDKEGLLIFPRQFPGQTLSAFEIYQQFGTQKQLEDLLIKYGNPPSSSETF